MQIIHADNVKWEADERGVKEAEVFSDKQVRIDLVELPSGSYLPPHRHAQRQEYITILLSAGAQMQIGERIFRPIAGQQFLREAKEILAITNDTPHPFRYSTTRFGYQESDVEWIEPEPAAAAE